MYGQIRIKRPPPYIYIYIWERLAHYGKPGRSPGAPAREPGSFRLTSRSVARRTGAEPRRVPWWLALVRLGGLPGWSDPLDLDRVPARGGTFCKADWAPRARNPIFVCHTSAAECKQKWSPRILNSGLPAAWLSGLCMSSPAVLNVLRFGWSEILKILWFSYVFEEKVNKTFVFIALLVCQMIRAS